MVACYVLGYLITLTSLLPTARALSEVHTNTEWNIACVVRLGNSSEEELDAFRSAARTWGLHCRWFFGLVPPLSLASAKQFLNGTKRTRLVPATVSSDPFQVLGHAFRTSHRGGSPDIACGLSDPFLFLAPENLQAVMVSAGVRPASGEVMPATFLCNRRLACQTRLAAWLGARSHSPSEVPTFRLGRSCGLRAEEVCAAAAFSNSTVRPVALHASGARQLDGLYATLFKGWPLSKTSSLGASCATASRRVFSLVGRGVHRLRVGVIIGSLMRDPASSLVLLGRLFADPQVDYSVFVYTSPFFPSTPCLQVLEFLEHFVNAEVAVATLEDVLEEDAFQAKVGSRHMRQWYKLSRAYAMMEARERATGRRFDLVFKMRTDVSLEGPIDLAAFPEVLSGRTIYTMQDIVFLCNRAVAQTLLQDILTELERRSGNESRIFPLNYGRILRGDFGNGLTLQVFPDVSAEFRTALTENTDYRTLRMAFLKHRSGLESAHRQAEQGLAQNIVSGHWMFRKDTKEYKYWVSVGRTPQVHMMCSVRHWFYHIHAAEPEVSIRAWPMKLTLSRKRHHTQCNCEPPDCIPASWPDHWALPGLV